MNFFACQVWSADDREAVWAPPRHEQQQDGQQRCVDANPGGDNDERPSSFLQPARRADGLRPANARARSAGEKEDMMAKEGKPPQPVNIGHASAREHLFLVTEPAHSRFKKIRPGRTRSSAPKRSGSCATGIGAIRFQEIHELIRRNLNVSLRISLQPVRNSNSSMTLRMPHPLIPGARRVTPSDPPPRAALLHCCVRGRRHTRLLEPKPLTFTATHSPPRLFLERGACLADRFTSDTFKSSKRRHVGRGGNRARYALGHGRHADAKSTSARRNPGDPGLDGTQEYPARCALYRGGAGSVKGFLEGLVAGRDYL